MAQVPTTPEHRFGKSVETALTDRYGPASFRRGHIADRSNARPVRARSHQSLDLDKTIAGQTDLHINAHARAGGSIQSSSLFSAPLISGTSP